MENLIKMDDETSTSSLGGETSNTFFKFIFTPEEMIQFMGWKLYLFFKWVGHLFFISCVLEASKSMKHSCYVSI